MSSGGRGPLAHALLLLASPIACASSGSASPPPAHDAGPADASPPPTIEADAGAPDGGVAITVTTFSPASSTAPAAKTSATWAAYRAFDGAWRRLDPSAPGTYVFSAHGASWGVAFACADRESSLLAVFERSIATTTFEATLETWCGPERPPAYTLTGLLANAPSTTTWLDFAYPLEARGAAVAVTGTSLEYELVNVTSGTWDLMFGLRDDSTAALSKLALVRGYVLSADATLDLDLTGAQAVTAETRSLVLHGVGASESIEAPVRYLTAGASVGLDLGHALPPPGPDITTTYATLPAPMQASDDRYRLDAVAGEGDTSTRGLRATFHDALDVDVTLTEPLEAPVVSVVATSPYLRVAATMATHDAAASYEVETAVRVTSRARRVWRVSIDAELASAPTVTLTIPDLSPAIGFHPDWTLPADLGPTTTATMLERPKPFGDGTIERFASRSVNVVVP